ncbi:MAG TPA: hypothetical protein VKE40_26170 [Gemmataceae bacterium]|nr:hypothetical protein [Gemmataceae bacterium]
MSKLSRREFVGTAAVAIVAGPSLAADSKKLVLIAGTPSHPSGAHEFNAGVCNCSRSA